MIAVARANRRRVDISYLAAELGWPRTSALRRLQRYAGSGHLTLTREGRHTYVDNTRESRRAALSMIDILIDSIDKAEPQRPGTLCPGVDRRARAGATASVRAEA
ncbi:MAG TPA: hypothetical protein VLE23_17605 [Geminicoccaceae bacterium]|nr:hypothetical protein [Geminicoccaceae bacterium]